MFQAVFTWAQAPMDLIKGGFDWLAANAAAVLPQGWLLSFVRNGVISGVGSVLVFLPQILTLFFFILLLEDFGYMARAAFLMDRIMGGAGLHGRAFIPLLSSFACAIPGIMATRVISSRRGRLATILVAPLMTCSARIPVYTLIIAAFIPARTVFGWLSLQGLVMFGLYTAGIASALGMSWVFNRFLWRREPSEPFMLELPDYKRPVLRNIALGLVQRGQIFLKRAGTTIFAMMVVIWFLCSVPPAPPDATEPAINYSLAARIGQVMEPVLRPVGFNWQIDVALVPGMAAREVAVAALGTVYSIAGAGENRDELGRVLTTHWSLATALALLAWYAFAPQCASTLGVVRRETASWKWTPSSSATCSRSPMSRRSSFTMPPSRSARVKVSLRGAAAVKAAECLGDHVGVFARVLDIVAHRLPIGAEVDNNIITDDPVIDRLTLPQLDIQAVGRGIVVKLRAHGRKSLSLKQLWTVSPSARVTTRI
jgi:ferrous iron transport protein B